MINLLSPLMYNSSSGLLCRTQSWHFWGIRSSCFIAATPFGLVYHFVMIPLGLWIWVGGEQMPPRHSALLTAVHQGYMICAGWQGRVSLTTWLRWYMSGLFMWCSCLSLSFGLTFKTWPWAPTLPMLPSSACWTAVTGKSILLELWNPLPVTLSHLGRTLNSVSQVHQGLEGFCVLPVKNDGTPSKTHRTQGKE